MHLEAVIDQLAWGFSSGLNAITCNLLDFLALSFSDSPEHKVMWLWRASHHNRCAQQVHQMNTRDLATAKPSRVEGRLKRD